MKFACKSVGFDKLSQRTAGFDKLSQRMAGFDKLSQRTAGFDKLSQRTAGFDKLSQRTRAELAEASTRTRKLTSRTNDAPYPSGTSSAMRANCTASHNVTRSRPLSIMPCASQALRMRLTV